SAHVHAACDLHVAVSRSLLAADVLEEPGVEPHQALGDGIHEASDLAAHRAPALGAEIVASVVALAALATVMTARIFVLVSLGAAVTAALTIALRRRIARLHERAVLAQQGLADAFTTTLHGRLELVAAGAEGPALARVGAAARNYSAEAKRTAWGVAVLGRTPLGAAVAVAGLVVMLDAGPMIDAWRTNGRPLLVLAAALPILLGVLFGLHEMIRVAERLRPFARLVLRSRRPELARRPTESQPEAVRSIRLEDVGFEYRPGTPSVLDGLDAEWNDGILVLRGPNGSGKSTALRLMLGLRDPGRGRVRFGGVDLRALDLRRLRASMSFLPQRPYLGEPYTTTADALAMLAPQASPDDMLDALDQVGLTGMLSRDGADPLVRTVGELSVGQRQRLALARVLLRNASVVLLDEPDANLDADGIARLVSIVEALGRSRMVGIAAHGPIADVLRGTVWDVSAPK
ncbi:MAG: ABC transporter ATP-binding protein, partial [Myxococcales bacterium]|nr:ABC transporter ATP-binding protein [Myxococcales bacterium]